MKKTLTLLLCLIMMLSLAIPASAETRETRTSLVSLELDPSMETYTLTIPADITIDPHDEETTVSISLENVNFVWSKRLEVYAKPQNWTADAWENDKCSSYLVHTEDATKKIPYLLKSTSTGEELDTDSNPTLLVTDAHIDPESGMLFIDNYGGLNFTLLGDYPASGTYTDTLTFTVELSR